MKKVLILSIILPVTTISFAAPTVQDCVKEITASQQSAPATQKMTEKQIETYCQCAVPQANKLLNNKDSLTQQEMKQYQDKFNQILSGCAKQAGISN